MKKMLILLFVHKSKKVMNKSGHLTHQGERIPQKKAVSYRDANEHAVRS